MFAMGIHGNQGNLWEKTTSSGNSHLQKTTYRAQHGPFGAYLAKLETWNTTYSVEIPNYK